MKCPKCHLGTAVVDSRPTGETIRRRRRCITCDYRFSTFEVPVEEVQDLDAAKKMNEIREALQRVQVFVGSTIRLTNS